MVKDGFIDFSNLADLEPDPATQALLTQHSQRQADARLSPKQRKARAKARAKMAKRHRKVYDLPKPITEKIKRLAEQHKCPESQVAALLLHQGLATVEAGQLDLSQFKKPSNSPRYDWNLEIDP